MGTYWAGAYSSISQLILGLSGEFWHDEATPWLLRQVDSIVANRDEDFGVPRKYNFSQGAYVDLQTGDKIHGVNDIIFLVGMYDLTNDTTYLDMVYEMGVDILNPVQVSARDMEDTGRLKREFGRDISFWGAIDTQRVLPLEGPEEVGREVKKRIEDLAKDGGYIVAAVHNIQDEVLAENIVAMYEAARKYGAYS